MTESEFENVESLDDDDDIAEKLQTMTLTELKLRPATSDLDFTQNPRGKDLLLSPDDLVYAETARWCLAALKNLTRPSTSPRACITLHKSGVLPLILRMITTVPPLARSMTDASSVVTDTAFTNATLSWEANSMQDAALFCVLNLAATPESRAVVMESDGVQLLSLIAEYEATDISVDEANQMEFQSLKAVSGSVVGIVNYVCVIVAHVSIVVYIFHSEWPCLFWWDRLVTLGNREEQTKQQHTQIRKIQSFYCRNRKQSSWLNSWPIPLAIEPRRDPADIQQLPFMSSGSCTVSDVY